jgi:hypothetical protein
MRDDAFYSKTDAGRDEIQTRARKLSQGMRSLLLMVDGKRDVASLRVLAAGVHAPPNALDQLLALQLIDVAAGAAGAQVVAPAAAVAAAPASEVAERYSRLSGLMTEAVREHLGLRGFFLQLRIERCSDVSQLDALLPDIAEAVARSRGRDYAREWEKGLRTAAAI